MPNCKHLLYSLRSTENSHQLFLTVCFFSIHMCGALFKEVSAAPTHPVLYLLCTLWQRTRGIQSSPCHGDTQWSEVTTGTLCIFWHFCVCLVVFFSFSLFSVCLHRILKERWIRMDTFEGVTLTSMWIKSYTSSIFFRLVASHLLGIDSVIWAPASHVIS